MKKPTTPTGKVNLTDLRADAQKHEAVFQNRSRPKSGTGQDKVIRLNPELFSQLPWILRSGCAKLIDPIEKEVFLISALGVISGLLPKVQGFYDTKYYGTNLYTYILGKYGSGKGSIQMAKMLGMKIHTARLQEYVIALKTYNQKMQQYKKDLRRFHNDKSNIIEQPEEPLPPPQTMLYIPVNNSKSGMFQLLDENQGRAILFETEGDTLVDAIKQDYGNYSDGLRKAFHHEEISFYRRSGKEFREINNPSLSLVLSSTFDQFLKLIPDIHNGLFSRFCYYILPPSRNFKNVFNKDKHDYPAFFMQLGDEMTTLYDRLTYLDTPVQFQLSTDQQSTFLSLFQEWKDELAEYVSDDLDGTVNRLGLIFFRIAMILSTLRSYEDDGLLQEITCTDMDFSLSLSVTETFKQVSLRLFYWFPETKPPTKKNEFNEKAQQINEAFKLRSTGMTYRDISKHLKLPRSTIYRWLNA
jgi:hypothetical protein